MIQETVTHSCKKCQSTNIVRNGHNACGSPLYKCKDCNAHGVLKKLRKQMDLEDEIETEFQVYDSQIQAYKKSLTNKDEEIKHKEEEVKHKDEKISTYQQALTDKDKQIEELLKLLGKQ